MIDLLVSIWHLYTSLPAFIRFLIEFLVIVIGVRIYVRRDIEVELDKRGIMQDGFFHALFRITRRTLSRLSVIWRHNVEKHRAHILECAQPACRSL